MHIIPLIAWEMSANFIVRDTRSFSTWPHVCPTTLSIFFSILKLRDLSFSRLLETLILSYALLHTKPWVLKFMFHKKKITACAIKSLGSIDSELSLPYLSYYALKWSLHFSFVSHGWQHLLVVCSQSER
jgi:hypothetical protein